MTETLHIAYVFRIFWENVLFNNFRGGFIPQPVGGFHNNGILENFM